ncbi:hypothetical protein K438DRAFT_1980704 [Mycena galopus ATCC 62051]|nr:hypothetical protein K438DRAFT_1980704 [Mycena galopus ATCC 62051]
MFPGNLSGSSMVLPNTPSNFTFANIPSSNATGSSGEKRGMEGPKPERILLMSLVVGLVLYLIFTLAFVVVKKVGCPRFSLWYNMRSALTNISGCISRGLHLSTGQRRNIIPSFVRPVVAHLTGRNPLFGSEQSSILPLHQISPVSAHSPSPTLPPRVHNPHEPQPPLLHYPPSLSDPPTVLQPPNLSQYSLAPSETPTVGSGWSDSPTVVRELAPRTGF